MKTDSTLSLRFKNQEDFGNFCVALTEDQIPFRHAGFHTVVLDQIVLERLPAKSRALFKVLKTQGTLEMSPTRRVSKRIVPTAKEAKKTLSEIGERWRRYGAGGARAR